MLLLRSAVWCGWQGPLAWMLVVQISWFVWWLPVFPMAPSVAYKYLLCIPVGHYKIKNFAGMHCVVLNCKWFAISISLFCSLLPLSIILSLIPFSWNFFFTYGTEYIVCIDYAGHIPFSPWFIMICHMFPMTCIMGAVVLSVTRWYPQQLFVFMGSIFQRSHLWQLALGTKASCLGDRAIVMGHCCYNYRSYRSNYNGTSFRLQLQIKGWTHVVVNFLPILLMSFSHILVTSGTWNPALMILRRYFYALCMQSAYRQQKSREEIYVVHLAIPPLPFETHICIVLLLLRSSGQSLRRFPVFFLSKPGGLWNLDHTVVQPGNGYLDTFI